MNQRLNCEKEKQKKKKKLRKRLLIIKLLNE